MNAAHERLNVFSGPDGMKKFLNPDYHLPTPLVELDSTLNPYISYGVRIFAKLQYLTPLFTGKWYVAYNMIMTAYKSGGLDGVVRLIENSSGGTAFALKIVASVVVGIYFLDAVVPRDMAPSKLEGLRLIGVNYVFSNSSGGMKGTEEARKRGEEPGCFNPDQYSNPANWEAHAKWLGPQMWDQTGGDITNYYGPMGTGGHVLGPKHYFESIGATVRVRGVIPTTDQVPGARTLQRIHDDVLFDLGSLLETRIEIDPKSAYKQSLALVHRGILAGPSSGMAFAGALKDLGVTRGQWDSYRNRNGEIVAVFPCVDIMQLYAEKYSTHLDPSDLE